MEPRLSTTDYLSIVAPRREALGLSGGGLRVYFSSDPISLPGNPSNDPVTGQSTEVDSITYALDNLSAPIYLWYSVRYDTWLVSLSNTTDPFLGLVAPLADADAFVFFAINKLPNDDWQINSAVSRLIAQSSTTQFWNTNTTERTVNYDTLNSLTDSLIILKANVGYEDGVGETILEENIQYVVLGQELDEENSGNLPDNSRLSVLPADTNGDGIADNIQSPELFNLTITGTWDQLRAYADPPFNTIPLDYLDLTDVTKPFEGRRINDSVTKGRDMDVEVLWNNGVVTQALTYDASQLTPTGDLVMDRLEINTILVPIAGTDTLTVTFYDWVYFNRDDALSPWYPVADSDNVRVSYMSEDETQDEEDLRYNRYRGRYPMNFAWFHQATQLNLIDPAASNIIDIYIITKGYYTSLTRWLENRTDVEPDEPTPLDLRSSYSSMLDNKMISDTVVLHPGTFKILFGSRAIPQLQASFKVIRPENSSMTDNQVKARMVSIIRNFFDIETWEFGESFFFTELAASIHADLGPEIDSVVLVPLFSQNQFGDLFQVFSKEDELFIADISTTDIEVVQSYTATNIRQNP